ncbi:MAG: peptidylprolyl isomerase [bacterium]|nr:peptidylprolyl isomerase [bacterium]
MIPVANAVRRLIRVCAFAVLLSAVVAGAAAAEPLFVRLETGAGDILLVMYPELAPHHVDNFTHLARTGFYDGTSFHRIVPGFVIQGGDPNSKDFDPANDGMGSPTIADVLTSDEMAKIAEVNALLEGKGYTPIQAAVNLKAEFSAVPHLRGSLSMARSRPVDSAGSQFFICVDRTMQLDNKYTVFGHAVTGLDVADAIVSAEQNPALGREKPAEPVVVKQALVIDGVSGLSAEEQVAWSELEDALKSKSR